MYKLRGIHPTDATLNFEETHPSKSAVFHAVVAKLATGQWGLAHMSAVEIVEQSRDLISVFMLQIPA